VTYCLAIRSQNTILNRSPEFYPCLHEYFPFELATPDSRAHGGCATRPMVRDPDSLRRSCGNPFGLVRRESIGSNAGNPQNGRDELARLVEERLEIYP
jgi:hypothetical protein